MEINDPSENYKTGWIKIFRSIRSHWIWEDPVKLKWWLDLILQANHAEQKVAIKYTLFDCGSGECLMSLEQWAKRWRVSKGVVYRFFKLLEKDNMILLKNETQTTRITICNYASYQQLPNANRTETKRKRNANETQPYTNNNVKNVKNDKKGIYTTFESLKTHPDIAGLPDAVGGAYIKYLDTFYSNQEQRFQLWRESMGHMQNLEPKEFLNLYNGLGGSRLSSYLDDMANWDGIKKKKSIYLTVKNWSKNK